jgi:cyclohexanone monooxygenase
MTAMFDDQAQHISYIVREVQQRGKRVAEVTPEAEAAWVAEIRRLAISNRDYQEACTPGYYNNEGLLDKAEGSLASEVYAPGINAFNALLAEWREAGDLPGMLLR